MYAIFYNISIYIYPKNFMKWTLNAGYSTHGSHVGLVLAAQPGWCPCSGCWSSSSGWVCSVAPPGLKHATCWNTARMDGFDLPTWSNLQLGISHLIFYNLIWLNIFFVAWKIWALIPCTGTFISCWPHMAPADADLSPASRFDCPDSFECAAIMPYIKDHQAMWPWHPVALKQP